MTVHFIKTMQVRRVAVWISLVLITAVAACGEAPSSPPRVAQSRILQKAGQVAASGEVAAAVAGRTERGAEDDLLRLEADVPTFGGLYFDGKGHVVLLLTDLDNSRVATVHLRQHMAGWLLPTEARHLVDTDQGVVIQQAQFRFSSLVSWSKQLARDPSLRQYGMVSLDADEARNRIAIGLVDLSMKDRLLASAARLGIPTEAIVITRDQASMPSSDLRDNKRPTGAGVQVENVLRCSLGWNVTDALARVGFLTAGHCLSFPATGQGGLGAIFGQPTIGAPIGELHPISWTPYSL